MLATNLRGSTIVAQLAGFLLSAALGLVPACRASETEAADSDRVEQLIESLGSDRFFVREWAQAELSRIGLGAFDALMEAEFHEDIEIAARAQYLLRSLRIEWTSATDHPAVRRIFFDYDSLHEPGRQQRIERLSLLEEDAALEALCRLVRFERSGVLSKRATLVVLDVLSSRETSVSESTQMILQRLGQSRRRAAGWLTTYLAIRSDAGEDPSRWSELVREEESIWQRWPHQSHHEILLALLRHEAILLQQFDRHEEALAAMRRMIELESGDTETLAELIRWLADRQAWGLVDETVRRFEARFDSDPLLLYTLAAARQSQGQPDQAEELVEAAQKLEPKDLAQHLAVAKELFSRGLHDWAQREFHFVIQSAPQQALINTAVDARWLLAYMLHERQEHWEAAQLLNEPVDELAKQSQGKLAVSRSRRQREQDWKGRMHYYYACHWENVGDRGEQLKHLEAAAHELPFDVDVLIALYRFPDSDPKQQAPARSRIKQSIALYRQQIEKTPDDVKPLNKLAWLIAHTEGDLDLALGYSKKSLEIQPGNAGLLDTLAYCYFARGKFEEAVNYQTMALRREPHSTQMRRQLEQFKKALESSPPQRSAEDVPTAP